MAPKAFQLVLHNKDVFLAALPPEVHMIRVQTVTGKTRFKRPDEVEDDDQLVLDSLGDPIVTKGPSGRPKKPSVPPPNRAVSVSLAAKYTHIKNDELLRTVRKSPEKSLVLDQVMEGIAEEAASLQYERLQAEMDNTPTSQISLRRVNALKAVGDAWLKRKEILVSSSVDIESPAFQKLYGFIVLTFRDSLMAAGLRPEMIETVFAGMSRRIGDDAWQKEAIKAMTEG